MFPSYRGVHRTMRKPRRHRFRNNAARLSFALAVATVTIAVTAPGAHAQELDRVVLQNGNPVVGEILELRRGDLSVDTDEMSVVDIDWTAPTLGAWSSQSRWTAKRQPPRA